MNDDVKSRAKQRLHDLLKTAVSGIVVAAASVTTPAVEAPAAPVPQATTFEERVEQLRKQIAVNGDQADATDETLVAFHNWGNHWHNWGDWHNWHNWHNH